MESYKATCKWTYTVWYYVMMAFALFKIDGRNFMRPNTPICKMRMESKGKIQKWNLTVKDLL